MTDNVETDATGAADTGNTPDPKLDKGGKDGAGDPPAAGAYRPEGLPDHLFGKTEKETIDLLNKAYKGSREELSRRDKSPVPEKFEDYALDLPEDLAKSVLKLDKDGKDPIFEAMKGEFHKAGITGDKAAAIIGSFFQLHAEAAAKMNEGIPPADFEYTEFGGADKAKPIVDAALANLDGLVETGFLTKEEAYEFSTLAAHGVGLSGLKKMLARTGEKPIPNGDTGGGQGNKVTQEMVNARVADPRYQRGPKFDQAYYDATVKMFEELHGTEQVA